MAKDTDYNKLLAGKRAFVTTGARGIGFGIAELFAKQGAAIALGGKTEQKLRGAIQKIKTISPGSESYSCDLSDGPSVHGTCAQILRDFGGIDVLVNVVGVNRRNPVHAYDENDFDYLLNTNYKSALICMKYFVPGMLERKSGSVVQISSIHSEQTMPGNGLYAGTKGALNAMSRAAALDCARGGVRVNVICPGLIMSDQMRDEVASFPEGEKRDAYVKLLDGMQPLPPGQIIDIANAALYLASDMSAYVTGQSLMVDGGASVKAH